MSPFPLKFPAQIERYFDGIENELGNKTPGWLPAETVLVFGWEPPVSAEPELAGHDRVVVDVKLYAPQELNPGPKDRITLDGRQFEVIGYPQDPNNNPFWQPGLVTVLLKRIEG